MEVDKQEQDQDKGQESTNLDGNPISAPFCLISRLRDLRERAKSQRVSPHLRGRRIKSHADKFLAEIESPSQAEFRVAKDMEEIKDAKWCARGTALKISFPTKRLLFFSVKIIPVEGFYRNGEFNFDICVPEKYPYVAPKILCKDKVFHPNFDIDCGRVGLSIAYKDWLPILSMNDILLALQLLFCEPNVPQNYNPNENDMIENTIKRIKTQVSEISQISDTNMNQDNCETEVESSVEIEEKEKETFKIVLNDDACKLYQSDNVKFDTTVQDMIRGKYSQRKKFNQFWPCLLSKRAKDRQNIDGNNNHNNNNNISKHNSYNGDETWKMWNNGNSNSRNENGNSNGNRNSRRNKRRNNGGHSFVKTGSICGKRKFSAIDDDNIDRLDMDVMKDEITKIDGSKGEEKSDVQGSLVFVSPNGIESQDFWQPAKKKRRQIESNGSNVLKNESNSNNGLKQVKSSNDTFASSLNCTFETNNYFSGFGDGFSGFSSFSGFGTFQAFNSTLVNNDNDNNIQNKNDSEKDHSQSSNNGGTKNDSDVFMR